MGDFNLVEDTIDHLPCKADDLLTTEVMREFKMRHDLIDGWRLANPLDKGYTWSRKLDGTQSRIDRIYTWSDLFKESKKWNIEPAPFLTDHDLVSAVISMPTTPEIGRGRWALPI